MNCSISPRTLPSAGHAGTVRRRAAQRAVAYHDGVETSLTITVDDRLPVTVVAVAGELDLTTAPELLQALTRLVDEGCHRFVVDLARLEFCDSSGLSVLVRVRNRLDELSGEMTLAGPTAVVQRVLEVSGLAAVFGTYPTVADARAALDASMPG